MKRTTTEITEIIICDECQKTYNKESWEIWLSFVAMTGDVWIRLFERVNLRNSNTRHLLAWKVEYNFCSKECVRKFLQKTLDEFIQEIVPSNDRGKNINFLQ